MVYLNVVRKADRKLLMMGFYPHQIEAIKAILSRPPSFRSRMTAKLKRFFAKVLDFFRGLC